MDKHSRISNNLLIFSTIIALLLYITYSVRSYHDRSFQVENNPLIKTNDAALALASHENQVADIAQSDLTLIAIEDAKDTETKEIEVANGVETETQDKIKDERLTEKDTIVNNENIENLEVSSRGTSLTDSRVKREINVDGALNQYVLNVIETYRKGNYPYLLNTDYENYNGVTENLYYQGELLLKSNPNGNKASHCTGITFEVFFKAMQNRNKDLGIDINNFNGMSKNELYDFALIWYVAKGPKNESNIAIAMERYGVGKRIYNMEELRSGDFIDFSRENNTGHTAVFINWIRESDKIVGFKYWSSQGSTKGISYNEEYFNIKRNDGSKYGNVIIDNLYMARVNPVGKYKSYK